jgi:hypothetical protein
MLALLIRILPALRSVEGRTSREAKILDLREQLLVFSREANRVFCAWRQNRRNSPNRVQDSRSPVRIERTSAASRGDFSAHSRL